MQKKWNNWFIFLVLQIIVWQIIFSKTEWCNFIFNEITLRYNAFIYLFTSKINFPIGEFFYLILFLFLSIKLLMLFKKSSFQFKLLKLSKIVFFVYLSYNLIWGISYYKTSFDLDINNETIDKEKLKMFFCDDYFKAEYLRSSLTNESNTPIQFNLIEEQYIQDFNENQQILKQEKWIQNYSLIENPVVKMANISMLMNHIGILGYYNPFTIESNINKYNTALKKSFTISHELAHQMGFASENEANFIAYLIGIHSKYKEVKYATYYKSIHSILGNIATYDPLFVKAQIDGMSEDIKKDRVAELAYYSRYDGKANDAFSAMNNQFLKANNQEGIVSYSKYIELLYWYKIKKANN